MATVRIPSSLRSFTKGESEVQAQGATVREIFDDLEKHHPGLKERICAPAGNVLRHVNVFVSGDDIRFLQDLATPVEDNAEIDITPALAGG